MKIKLILMKKIYECDIPNDVEDYGHRPTWHLYRLDAEVPQ